MDLIKSVFNYSSPTNIHFHGLMNQGSTCYLNSVLQVLFMTKDFREAVKRFAEENPDTECIDHDLKDLFMDLEKCTTYTYKMTKKLGITKVYEQQDAAEYFEKILRLTSPEASQIFHGKLAHETTCCNCGTQTGTAEQFWQLPLALDSSRKDYSVEGGIKEFFKTSEFIGDNQMYCDRCDDKNDATSKYVIKNHPEVLMLLLKRFDFNYYYMTYVKINCVVDVPYSLQIPEGQTYELYAVVDHWGDLRSGHYSATIKDENGDRWYHFDDTRVTLPDYQPFHKNNTEKSQSAYLLFYRKKTNADSQDSQEVSNSGGVQPITRINKDQGQDAEKIRDRGEGEDAPGDSDDTAASVFINRPVILSAVSTEVVPPPGCENVENPDNEGDVGQTVQDNRQEHDSYNNGEDDSRYKQGRAVGRKMEDDEEDMGEKTEKSKEELEKSLVENFSRDQQQDNGELVSVRQNRNKHQDSKQKTGEHYDPKQDYMAKQRGEKMKTDMLVPDSNESLTRYDLFNKANDHDDREDYMKENVSKDDQGSRSRMERKHERKREKERDVTGDTEQRRPDEHAKGEKSTVNYEHDEVVGENNKGRSSQSISKDQEKTRQRMSLKRVSVEINEDTEIIKYQLMKTENHSGNDGRAGDYPECKKDTIRNISLRHAEDKMGYKHVQSSGSTIHCSVHDEDNGRSHERQKQGVQYPHVSVKEEDSHSRRDMKQGRLSGSRGERIDQSRHHDQFKRLGDTGPEEKSVRHSSIKDNKEEVTGHSKQRPVKRTHSDIQSSLKTKKTCAEVKEDAHWRQNSGSREVNLERRCDQSTSGLTTDVSKLNLNESPFPKTPKERNVRFFGNKGEENETNTEADSKASTPLKKKRKKKKTKKKVHCWLPCVSAPKSP